MANTPYAELGKKADALVTLYYRKPDEDQLNDILKLAQTCVECYIHSAVYSSRSGEGGVPAYIDPGDILNTTLGNIARAVKEKRYTVGTFNGYAVTVAKRAFLDTMKRKQLPYERGSDEEQEEKSERPHARTEEPQAYCDQAAVVEEEPMAKACGSGSLHVGLSRVVDRPDCYCRHLLVQQRKVG